MAFFLPEASPTSIKIIAYNLEKDTVNSTMSVWNIQPGQWKVSQGVDVNDDQRTDKELKERIVKLERGNKLDLSFPPIKYGIVHLELVKKAEKDYWERSDLAISEDEIKIEKNKIIVRIYNQGAVTSKNCVITYKDNVGNVIDKAMIPSLEAPLDLIPKWVDITLNIPGGIRLGNGIIELDPDKINTEITRINNTVKL